MGAERYLPPWFSVAPMMEWTDNHYRTMARLISKHAWLYTEMLAAETIVYQEGNLDRFLAFGPEQHPIVLQIGGNDLGNLAKATQLATPYGYDEINFKFVTLLLRACLFEPSWTSITGIFSSLQLRVPESQGSWTRVFWSPSHA
nr:tRNA-dihydrouridine(20/20A) synthase-like isoform X1 [Ipomoea batatas]